MATAQGDFILVNEVEDVDDFGSIAGYALEGDVMRLLVVLVGGHFVVEDGDFLLILKFDFNRKPRLAQLTLQVLPEVRRHGLPQPLYLLPLQPFFQAVDVDEAHGASAFAG